MNIYNIPYCLLFILLGSYLGYQSFNYQYHGILQEAIIATFFIKILFAILSLHFCFFSILVLKIKSKKND